MPSLSVRLFGSPQLEIDGLPVETDRRKAVALLALLALDPAGRSRETLAAFFWPDFDSSRAFAYLRRTLWELNQVLGEGWVQAERELVRLDPAARTWVDVSQFERILDRPAGTAVERSALEEAVALYRGDFMAGFALRDSPEFDAWQVEQAERLRLRFASALEALSRSWAASGEFEPAIAHARRALALDPLQEAAQRWLMELYALAGQRSAALRQFEACTRLLDEELNVEPEAETRALVERIRQGQIVPAVPALAPPLVQAPAPPPAAKGSLPVQLPRPATAFVGREKELVEIARLLADPDCRLLTLVGPGGIGKTRLSIQAAQAAAGKFRDGAYFVPLAPIPAPEQIVAAIAAALQFRFKDKAENSPLSEPLEQLADYLRQRQLLLVLDNFEHLVAGAGLLSELLAAAPQLKMLATSRERLNLPEEWAMSVGGMEFPAVEDILPPEGFAAVRLFLQAARQSQVGFAPNPQDLHAIRRICQLVDGMPLGIEMAAAWVRMLSCPEIATEIERSLDFLESMRAGVPERHRNLRAVFEHSWALLNEPERVAFQALSVFKGGFTRQAAAQVTGASLGMLSSLVDKSLVRRSPEGRYDLHEVLKRFAAEKLENASRQKGELQEAHRQYYLALSLDAAEQLEGAGQKAALALVQQEAENVRAAWLLTAQQGDYAELEDGLIAVFKLHEVGQRHRAALALVRPALNRLRADQAAGKGGPAFNSVLGLTLALLALYYLTQEQGQAARPFYTEYRALLPAMPEGRARAYSLLVTNFGASSGRDREMARQNFESCAAFLRSRGDNWGLVTALLVYGSLFEYEQGYNSQMNDLTRQALAIVTQDGNRWGMAICYHQLAVINYWLAEYDAASAYGLQALEVYLDLNDRWRVMEVQVQLGRIETDRGGYSQARRYFQENVAYAQELGSRYFTALNQDCLGYVELLDGRLDEAERCYQSSLELYRALNSRHGEGMAWGNLGDVALARADYDRARACFSDALEILKNTDDTWGRSIQIKKLGLVALQSGRYAEAASLLEQALTISRQVNRLPDIQEVCYLLARLKLQNGDPGAARALLDEVLAHPATTPSVRAQATELARGLGL